MRKLLFFLVCGAIVAEAAYAQEMGAPEINPNALAPAARPPLPGGMVIEETASPAASQGAQRAPGAPRSAKQRRAKRSSK